MNQRLDPITFARRLRRRQTNPERILWQQLRNRELKGIKFKRQKPIGPYIVDFYCAQFKLVIELDGDSHDFRKAYDRVRDAYLREQGLHVMRFKNETVYDDGELIHEKIMEYVRSFPSPCPSPQGGEGTTLKK